MSSSDRHVDGVVKNVDDRFKRFPRAFLAAWEVNEHRVSGNARYGSRKHSGSGPLYPVSADRLRDTGEFFFEYPSCRLDRYVSRADSGAAGGEY